MIDAMRGPWSSFCVGVAASVIRAGLMRHDGSLRTSRFIPVRIKHSFANYDANKERSDIALAVAGQWPGGDYLEFGSESFTSLRSFLTAFDVCGQPRNFPDTRFFAFDVFGDAPARAHHTSAERAYFSVYSGKGNGYYADYDRVLDKHGLLLDKVTKVKGYFQDTLNDDLSRGLQAGNRGVGFAYLDCNILPSYEVCLSFLKPLMRDRSFMYLDEYFQTPGVTRVFKEFCSEASMEPIYIRNAGTFGALFQLVRS